MENYIAQLLCDIACVTANVALPFVEKQGWSLPDWVSPDEEEKFAPVRQLEEWTGIRKDHLPPAEMLADDQVHQLLEALKKMLDAYNWSFVMQIEVPERIQYETIRRNFDQEAKIKQWYAGFFEVCQPGTKHKTCTLADYCHCAFFAELFSNFVDEDLSPEEERSRALEIEVQHLKRKHDDDWMKYYPYHLDPGYDDENGNPYNYGVDDDGDDDEEEGGWWRQ